MKMKITVPPAPSPKTETGVPANEDNIREYAYHLYEQSHRAPGRDLENWLEASACLQANIAPDHSAGRLHRHLHGPGSGPRAEPAVPALGVVL